MNSTDLRAHLSSLGVKPAGIDYFVRSALSPPQMRLRSGPRHNIVGDVSTTLRTFLDDAVQGDVVPRMQIASMSVEHAYVVHLEARGNVLLALNHPLSVPLLITNTIGRSQRINYTCDALVLDDTHAWAVELKTDEGARELVKERPVDWRQIESGFEYLPAKEHFASLGLEHCVVVSSQLPWLRTRNQQMLARVPARQRAEDDGVARQRVLSHVASHSPCSMLQLIAACELPNANPILRLIREGAIHVDLDRAQLSCPETRSICSTADGAKNVATVLASIQSAARTNASVPFARAGDPWHLDELGFRLSVLEGRPAVRDSAAKRGKEVRQPSLRTKQRWAKAKREGGLTAVAPKWNKCGNRKPRLERWHRKLLRRHIKTARRATTAPSRTHAHVDYTSALKAESTKRKSPEKPVSYGYFCRLWNRRLHNVGDAYQRGGRRMANAVAPHGDVDKQLPMTTGPFQIAHVDHCLAPAHSEEEGNAGLPWITLLVDDWESEPLAMVITFAHPSAETDIELLRVCARRHGRLPHAIISDHGSDFKGNVFIGALAVLGIDAFLRPEANPRAGQPVERTFGTVAEAVCRGYEGFALNIPNSRAISAAKHPSRGRKRPLQHLEEHCEHLLFSVIPNLRAIGGGDSRLQKRLNYQSVYGEQGVPTKIDLTFMIATAPPLRESGCVEPSGAIRLNEKRYYSEKLVGVDLGVRRLKLRREPEDQSIIYFAHEGKWHVAKARDALKNYGRSDDVIAREAREGVPTTQQERVQRRQALHSKPTSTKATTTDETAKEASKPSQQSTAPGRVSLSDVKALGTLPPAFADSLGSAP